MNYCSVQLLSKINNNKNEEPEHLEVQEHRNIAIPEESSILNTSISPKSSSSCAKSVSNRVVLTFPATDAGNWYYIVSSKKNK